MWERFGRERLQSMCEREGASVEAAIDVLRKVAAAFPAGTHSRTFDGVEHSVVSYARRLCRDSATERAVWDFLTN